MSTEPTAAEPAAKSEASSESPGRGESAAGWVGGSSARSRWNVARPWVATVARIALGTVWIVAGASKVPDLAAAVRSVRAYQVLPEWAVPAVGAGLPFLEIALGALLIIGLGVRFGGIVSAALFAIFIAGIVSASARGLRIDCGCFGGGGELDAGEQTKYTAEIVRDLGFIALACAVSWLRAGRLSVDRWLAGPAEA